MPNKAEKCKTPLVCGNQKKEMLILGQTDSWKATELLGEASGMRGAYSETTSSAGGCFPRGSIFPPYLDIGWSSAY